MSHGDDSNIGALLGEVLGGHMKLSKTAVFTLDGVPIPTGPDGFRFTPLVSTAAYGKVRFEDDFPVEKDLRLFIDGFPRYGEELPEGWSFSSWLLGAAADDQMLTFTGPYGAWRTLKNVVSQYLIKGGLFLPVCSLGTRPRGDEYNNTDPVFNIVGWKDVGAFAKLFPGLVAMPRLSASPSMLTDVPGKVDAMIKEANAPASGRTTFTTGHSAVRHEEGAQQPSSPDSAYEDDDQDSILF